MELLVIKQSYFTMPQPHRKKMIDTIMIFYTNTQEIINLRLPDRVHFSLEQIINFAYEEYLAQDMFEMAKAIEDTCIKYKMTLQRNRDEI